MIPASLDSGHRLIADTLAAFRAGPALGSIALRPAPRSRVPLYIGIAGSKRSGKDTLANGLASALSLPCDSFAAPLRQLVASLLGLSLHELDSRKEDAIDWLAELTPRHLMQTAGTEWGVTASIPSCGYARCSHACPRAGWYPTSASPMRPARSGAVVVS